MEIENRRFQQPGIASAAYCSAGLHPWYLNDETLGTAIDWLESQAKSPQVLAIGEAGLDKMADTSWELQLTAFQRCIEISEAVQKPLIIHCVRAFNEIIALKKLRQPQQPWIFHGFKKKRQTAAMLLEAGCFLSFGKAIFQEKNHAATVLAQMPPGRFFLETDDAADLDIETVYRKAADVRGIKLEDLQEALETTYNSAFR